MLKVELLKNIAPKVEQSRKNGVVDKPSSEESFKGLLMGLKNAKREHEQYIERKERAEDKKGNVQLRQKAEKIENKGGIEDNSDKVKKRGNELSKSSRDNKKSKGLDEKGKAQAGFVLLTTLIEGKKDLETGKESAEKGDDKGESGKKRENNVNVKNSEIKSAEKNLKAVLSKLKSVKNIGHSKDSKHIIIGNRIVIKHKAPEVHLSKKSVGQVKSGIIEREEQKVSGKNVEKIDRTWKAIQKGKPASESKNINHEKRNGDLNGSVESKDDKNREVRLLKGGSNRVKQDGRFVKNEVKAGHVEKQSKKGLDLKTTSFCKGKKFNTEPPTDREIKAEQKSGNQAESHRLAETPKMAGSKNKENIERLKVIRVDSAEVNKNEKSEVKSGKTNYKQNNLGATQKNRDVDFSGLEHKELAKRGSDNKLNKFSGSNILKEKKVKLDLTGTVHKSTKKDSRVIETEYNFMEEKKISENRDEVSKKGFDSSVNKGDKSNQIVNNRSVGQVFKDGNDRLFDTELSKKTSDFHISKKRESRDGEKFSQIQITTRQDVKASSVSQTNNLSPPLDKVIEHIDKLLSLKPPLTKSILVKVEPPYIGAVHIRVSIDSEKNLSATLTVHDKDTYKAIISHLNSLKDYLQSNGFRVQNVDVHNSFNENFFNQFSSSSGGFQQHSHTSQNSGQPAFGFFGGEVDVNPKEKMQSTKVIDGVDVIV